MRSFYLCPFFCKPRPLGVSLEFPGKKESTQSDMFPFGKMLEAAVRGRRFLPTFWKLITSTTAVDASKRPSISEVANELTKFYK